MIETFVSHSIIIQGRSAGEIVRVKNYKAWIKAGSIKIGDSSRHVHSHTKLYLSKVAKYYLDVC